MKALLICPSPRPAVRLLAETMPLANVPALGQGLLEYWLSHTAGAGFREVLVLANDRPEAVRALARDGGRWGLKVEVRPEARELTLAEALSKYGADWPAPAAQEGFALMDHFPGLIRYPLFASYRDWFEALCLWMARAKGPERVGPREIRDGIWMDLHARISPGAELYAPCWIGKNVIVGPRAVIGPRTILEEGAFIEPGALVVRSIVGPYTFIGKDTEVRQSIAWGDQLINWSTDSVTRVPDAFVMCSLRPTRDRGKAASPALSEIVAEAQI